MRKLAVVKSEYWFDDSLHVLEDKGGITMLEARRILSIGAKMKGMGWEHFGRPGLDDLCSYAVERSEG